jgi:hypothetical protein
MGASSYIHLTLLAAGGAIKFYHKIVLKITTMK